MPNRWSVTWIPPEIHQGMERMIIEGNPIIPEQFENQNKIPVYQFSCQVILSTEMQIKMWMYGILELPLSPILSLEWHLKENPPEFLTKWLPDFLMARKKMSVKLYIKKLISRNPPSWKLCCVDIIVVIYFLRAICKSKIHDFLKEVFH